METVKKIPLPMTGLILGVAALGNLVQSYGDVFRNILGLIAGLLLILLIAKLVAYPQQVKEELANPVVASVFPLYLLLSWFLNLSQTLFSSIAFGAWVIGIALHALLILWFSKNHLVNFSIKRFSILVYCFVVCSRERYSECPWHGKYRTSSILVWIYLVSDSNMSGVI